MPILSLYVTFLQWNCERTFLQVSGREFTFEIGFEIAFNGGKHDLIENESRLSSRMRDLF